VFINAAANTVSAAEKTSIKSMILKLPMSLGSIDICYSILLRFTAVMSNGFCDTKLNS